MGQDMTMQHIETRIIDEPATHLEVTGNHDGFAVGTGPMIGLLFASKGFGPVGIGNTSHQIPRLIEVLWQSLHVSGLLRSSLHCRSGKVGSVNTYLSSGL